MDMTTLFGLSRKRALVTGGTSGIGLAIAQAFAAAGARVAAASDREADCAAAAGMGLASLCVRLSDKASADALAAAARERLGGPLDILVANAGIEGPAGPTGEASEADYLSAFDVNVHSAYWLAAAVAPDMRAAGGGAIVMMASLAALRGNRAIGVYAMTKAALAQASRNLAVELGPSNIRVNAIAPGVIETPFSRRLMSDVGFLERRLAATPLRRVGKPSEIAATALWLVSPGGAFTTGQTIVVDGGALISDGS
jgi:NAD(P)-dependent dehydrogenase (short-subunit alcohol dehydrogenase family)